MKRLVALLCLMATVSCAGPDNSKRPEARPQSAANNFSADETIDRSAQENKQGGFFKSLRPVFRSPRRRRINAGSKRRWRQGLSVVTHPFRAKLSGVSRGASRAVVWMGRCAFPQSRACG